MQVFSASNANVMVGYWLTLKPKLMCYCCSAAKSSLTVTPWTAAGQAALSFTISQSLFKLMSIESNDAIQPSHPLSLCEMMLFPLLKTLPCLHISKLYQAIRHFPHGSVVKNPAANTGNTGWIPGPGQFHSGTGQLSPHTTTTEPLL